MRERAIGPEIPEPEYGDPKELYAFFGLAAYCAGLLELSLINLLAAIRHREGEGVSEADIDGIFDKLDALTFGRLLSDAREIVPFDTSTLEILELARAKRNFLVHHFFRVNAEEALTPDGCRRMIDGLREMAQLFRRADELADPIWRQAWAVNGVSEDLLLAEFERIRGHGSASG